MHAQICNIPLLRWLHLEASLIVQQQKPDSKRTQGNYTWSNEPGEMNDKKDCGFCIQHEQASRIS